MNWPGSALAAEPAGSAEDSGFAGMIFNGGELEKYQIPDYYFADGNSWLHGAANILPVSTTMCATWNEALSFAEGLAIATEARDMNLHCLLAPALNLQRNPLCGRHTEYFSRSFPGRPYGGSGKQRI